MVVTAHHKPSAVERCWLLSTLAKAAPPPSATRPVSAAAHLTPSRENVLRVRPAVRTSRTRRSSRKRRARRRPRNAAGANGGVSTTIATSSGRSRSHRQRASASASVQIKPIANVNQTAQLRTSAASDQRPFTVVASIATSGMTRSAAHKYSGSRRLSNRFARSFTHRPSKRSAPRVLSRLEVHRKLGSTHLRKRSCQARSRVRANDHRRAPDRAFRECREALP